MMTLEESIRFHTEEAEKLKQHKKVNEIFLGTEGYKRELQEHIQTAEWMKELQKRRNYPEIIRCKDCKHWKDSDGVYRRGFDAESKCPINIHQVYEGTFYCGLAERRTDE